MLAQRGTPEGHSCYSWTVDFAARRAKAHQEMQPFPEEATRIKAEIVDLKEKLKRLKKDKPDKAALEALEANVREYEKTARNAEAKAADIDAAVFDLKAVNPNAVANDDDRTPQQIIKNIETQGRIVAMSLARLGALLAQDS